MKESTRWMFQKHGWRADRAIHNYIYFVYYYPYVKTMYHLLKFLSAYLFWFKPFSPVLRTALGRYHSKVLSFGDTEKIFTINEDLSAVSSKNKKIVPFRHAYKILFQEPEFIAVMDCPCKKALGAEDRDINSCLAVGKKLASFWLDHGEKYHAKRISQSEAIDLIREFRKRGHLTQAFFKVATGGSTGVICNCHPDTCVSLKATEFARRFNRDLTMNADAGYAVRHDDGKCRACGACIEVCPVDVLELDGKEWKFDRQRCLGCELCVEHCENGALTLYRDTEKPVPLDIDIIKNDYSERN